MGLFLRKNGYYYVELELNGRKVQRSLKTKSRVFAKDLYHVILREKLLKDFFPEPRMARCQFNHGGYELAELHTSPSLPQAQVHTVQRVLLEVCYRDYLKDCISRGLGRRSMEDKERFIKILMRGGRPICRTAQDVHGYGKQLNLADFDKINPDNVDKFFLSLRSGTQAGDELNKHYAQDTIRKIACDLKSFLNYAIRQEAYAESQLKKLTFPKISVKVREAVYSNEQWQAIQKLASKDKDFLLYLKTLYYTMSRPNEIVSLSSDDIDKNGIIRIYQNKVGKYKHMAVPPPY